MDYKSIYDRLVARAWDREINGYCEVHHIVPRCIGGGNGKDNLVSLTAEEHFVAHQLLCKIYPEVKGLAFALVAMTGNPHGKRSNKAYGWIRRAVALAAAEMTKELLLDPEYRAKHKAAVRAFTSTGEYKTKISKIHKGRVKSEQECKNISEAGRRRAPRIFSDEAKKSFSAAQKRKWVAFKDRGMAAEIAQKAKATRIANGGYVVSEEQRHKISESQRGRVITPEHRAKISAALKGRKKTPEHIEKIAVANRKPVIPPTEEELAEKAARKFRNLSARSKGKELNVDHRNNIAKGLAAAYADGRRRGAMSKLTDEQVREIRSLLADPMTIQRHIAKQFGVSQTVISEIKSGKAYQNVK